jgi:hypothetical protein
MTTMFILLALLLLAALLLYVWRGKKSNARPAMYVLLSLLAILLLWLVVMVLIVGPSMKRM